MIQGTKASSLPRPVGITILILGIGVIPLLPILSLLLFGGGRVFDYDTQKWVGIEILAGSGLLCFGFFAARQKSITVLGGLPSLMLLLIPFLHLLLSLTTTESRMLSLERTAEVAALAIFAFLAATVAPAIQTQKKILSWMAIITGVVALYGVLQTFGLEFSSLVSVERRAVSSIGNTNTSGAFVVPSAAIAFCFYLLGKSRLQCAIWLILFYLLLFLLLKTSSRGAWIATGASVAATFFCVAFRSNAPPLSRLLPRLAVLGCVLLPLLPVLLAQEETPELLRRVKSISSSAHNTNRVRLSIAKSTLDMALEAPLLGHGPGTFSRVYPVHRSPVEARVSGYDREVRSAHNEGLEIFAEGGILMVIPFLLLLVLALRFSLMGGRKDEPITPSSDPQESHCVSTAIFCALCGLIAISLFRSVLRNPAAALFFTILLGLSFQASHPLKTIALSRGARWFTVILAFSVSLPLFHEAVFRLRSDLHAQEAQALLSRIVSTDGPSGSTRVSLLQKTRDELLLAYSLRPVDVNAGRRAVHHLRTLSQLLNQPSETEQAISISRKILEVVPDDPGTRLNLAVMLIQKGHPDEARKELEAHFSRTPWDPRPPFNLGLLSLDAGNSEEAKKHFQKVVELDPTYADDRRKEFLKTRGRERASILLFHLLKDASHLPSPDDNG